MTFLQTQPITSEDGNIFALEVNFNDDKKLAISIVKHQPTHFDTIEDIEQAFITSCITSSPNIARAKNMIAAMSKRGVGNLVLHGPYTDNVPTDMQAVELPYLGTKMFVCYRGSSDIDGGAFYSPFDDGSTITHYGFISPDAANYIVEIK